MLQLVLREFLNPRLWKPSEDPKFFLDADQINSLCELAERVFKSEPSVLRLKGNVFGKNLLPPCSSLLSQPYLWHMQSRMHAVPRERGV